jgi:MFS family permease
MGEWQIGAGCILTSTLPEQQSSAQAQDAALHRRTLRVIVASQVLSGAGLAAGITTGALLAQDMFSSQALSGAPAALFTLGSASAAVIVGRLSQRWGRRVGLVVGYCAGAIGAVGVVVATAESNLLLFLLALLLYGAGTATNLQARYAGADLAPPARRATSMSIILVAATVGAVAGPNLAQPMARVAESIGVPPLAGVFVLAAAAYAAAAVILHLFLRPDPYLRAKLRLSEGASDATVNAMESNVPGLIAGAAVMVIIQLVMVGIMTMTPVHMRLHGHALPAIGLVIGAHVGAMYLPSLVTGVLVDRLGAPVMAALAGLTLGAAAVVGAVTPVDSLSGLVIALILLGLGWNFGLLSGTSLIVEHAAPARRARIQGNTDLLIALAGASGGLGAGFVHAASGYARLSIIGGCISLAILIAAAIAHAHRAAKQ